MLRVLASDFYKIRKKMIWFLVFLGPIGVIALQTVNFGLRYDYLTNLYAGDLWGGVIKNVQFLSIPALLMGTTILASMIANIEHQTHAWKQLLALPISRTSVFTAKFTLTCALLLVSSTLLVIAVVVFGLLLGYGTDIPYGELCSMAYFPFLASMPFIALQVWLSVMVKNQAVPLTIGITSAILTLSGSTIPEWVPVTWPYLSNDLPLYYVSAGLALGLAVYLFGLMKFITKDVQ
jgi:lantibiotic transport system permease protein